MEICPSSDLAFDLVDIETLLDVCEFPDFENPTCEPSSYAIASAPLNQTSTPWLHRAVSPLNNLPSFDGIHKPQSGLNIIPCSPQTIPRRSSESNLPDCRSIVIPVSRRETIGCIPQWLASDETVLDVPFTKKTPQQMPCTFKSAPAILSNTSEAYSLQSNKRRRNTCVDTGRTAVAHKGRPISFSPKAVVPIHQPQHQPRQVKATLDVLVICSGRTLDLTMDLNTSLQQLVKLLLDLRTVFSVIRYRDDDGEWISLLREQDWTTCKELSSQHRHMIILRLDLASNYLYSHMS